MDPLCPWVYLRLLCLDCHPLHGQSPLYDQADDSLYPRRNFASLLIYRRAKGLARVQVLGVEK